MIEIERSEIARQVLDGLKSKHTRRNYVTYLNRFVNDYLGGEFTVEELVAEAREDVRKTQKRLDGFYQWLQTVPNPPLRENAAFQATHGPVRGFFSNLDIRFERKWGRQHAKREHISEAIQQDAEWDFFPLDEESRTIRFDRERMQKFLSNLKLRDQAITLCLLSSSQDSGDLFTLDLGYVRRQSNPRIFWEGIRDKTEISFRTFFSKEATRLVRRYIDQERKGAGDEEPLFVYTAHKRNGQKFRMEGRYLSSIFRETARRHLGITWKRRDQNPLRPKRMRHLFRSACDTVGLNELFINCFMGHRNSMGQRYSELTRAKLELEYLRVEPFVTVYGSTEETEEVKGEVLRLRTTVETLSSELEAQKKRMEEMVDEKVKELQEMFNTKVEKAANLAVERFMHEIEPLREEDFDLKEKSRSKKLEKFLPKKESE